MSWLVCTIWSGFSWLFTIWFMVFYCMVFISYVLWFMLVLYSLDLLFYVGLLFRSVFMHVYTCSLFMHYYSLCNTCLWLLLSHWSWIMIWLSSICTCDSRIGWYLWSVSMFFGLLPWSMVFMFRLFTLFSGFYFWCFILLFISGVFISRCFTLFLVFLFLLVFYFPCICFSLVYFGLVCTCSSFFSSLVSPHLGYKGNWSQRSTDPSSKNFDFFINLSSPFKAINSLKMLYKSINKYQKWWV